MFVVFCTEEREELGSCVRESAAWKGTTQVIGELQDEG